MWSSWTWTESIKKRVCRYLLQRYLGQYLTEKLTLDQLTVDLFNGTGNVRNVSLDCQALNLLAEQQSIPIEFKEGHLQNISVSVPWASLMQDSCEIIIDGLEITIQPKRRFDNGSSMIDSMFTSMASSMQLAEECLKSADYEEEKELETDIPFSGLEHCAQAIDAILSRVKMCFRDTIVRMERIQPDVDVAIALEFQIKLAKFFDEFNDECGNDQKCNETAFSRKKITIEGVTCYSDIFKVSQNDAFRDENLTARNNNSILIGKFAGKHEIKLKIKTQDSINEPQLTLDCSFGSLIAFLSPIQAHILYTFLDEFISSNSHEYSEARKYCKEKPMDSFDFKRVEEELQEQLKPGAIGLPGLQKQHGWSSPIFDEAEDEFLPLKSKSKMITSINSTLMNASMNTSNYSSMIQSGSDTMLTSFSEKTYNLSTIEKSKFNIVIASSTIILLHEDVLKLSNVNGVEPSSLEKMKELSKTFFHTLGIFAASVTFGKKDIDAIRAKLNAACSASHLRLLAAPVKLEGMVFVENNIPSVNGHISFGFCELIESLDSSNVLNGTLNPRCIEILTFAQSSDNNFQSLKIEFKNKSFKTRPILNKTSLRFQLNECKLEVDISLYDRIYSIIHSILYDYTERKDIFKNQMDSSKSQSVVSIKIHCQSFCSVNLRFPIPDLRPEGQKLYYKIRNLRNDSILFKLKDLTFSTMIKSTDQIIELDTKCQSAKLHYLTNQDEDPYLFAEISADDNEIDTPSLNCRGFDLPRVQVWIYPEAAQEIPSESEISEEGDSIENILSQKSKEYSPFSSRKIIHEYLSSQSEEKEFQESNSGESVVIPGDRTEMNEFIEATSKNTIYRVEINLRSVEAWIPSKKFFEELYNRISTDLLLYDFSAPKFDSFSKINNLGNIQNFTFCKSGIKIDSDSDSEEEGVMPFFTTKNSSKPNNSSEKIKKKLNGQSEVTINLSISKGICTFLTPFLDVSGNIIFGQNGQIGLKIEEGNLFVVSSYKGNVDLGYLCLHTYKASFFHCEYTSMLNPNERPVFGKHLLKTISPIDNGIMNKLSDSTTSEHLDMLSVAVRIERDESNIKSFKIAIGIKDGKLDHRVAQQNSSWFSQMVEFFDVTDTPIEGYTPAKIIMELHLHLWNCCVIYSPLRLKLRSILTVENFSISSNIAAQSNVSVIRFIAEDAAFFLSTNLNSTDLRNDYVCVLDMDFFEFCLRMFGKQENGSPNINLTASNNVLHIRTCSDSMKALTDLITYFSNNMDLESNIKDNISEDSKLSSYFKDTGPALIDNELSERGDDKIKDLLVNTIEQAAEEPKLNNLNKLGKEKELKTKRGFELHFMPKDKEFINDEEDKEEEEPEKREYRNIYSFDTNVEPLSLYDNPIMQTSNGMEVDINPSDDDEEEFLILENDPGIGILQKSGEPEARVLTAEPIRLIENHFSVPEGKIDILKAPKHYPPPVKKYTLLEMSIQWHMYGGEDFGPRKNCDKGSSETLFREDRNKDDYSYNYDTSQVDVAIDVLNPGVVFSKTKSFESAWEAYESSPKTQRKNVAENNISWRNQGGKGRNHNVLIELHLNKIKFQYEQYPENTVQASRQVIVINNLEIVDRLSSSQYNKMMYLYTSSSRPKQSHANMVLIKMSHIRPDPNLVNIEECCLKVSILPIRLNIDQDAILFLYQFFNEISSKPETDDDDSSSADTKPPSHAPSVESLPQPMMSLNLNEEVVPQSNQVIEEENLLVFTDEPAPVSDDSISTCSKDPSVDSLRPSAPIFFKQVTFSPDVPIVIDYRGKRLELTHGPLAGILMGLGQLDRSEIYLKRISHQNGILGYDKLINFLLNEWLQDIKKNQLPSLLGGVGPMYSFVQLFQGIRDLFWLPIEQYQKDGRLTKGIQKGATAFSTSTAMATLELTNRLVRTVQSAAEFTFDLVSPGPSVQQQRRLSYSKKKRAQPSDIREGMTNAYQLVKDGIGETAQNIAYHVSKGHEKKGVTGAVGGVLGQIPPTIVRPVILFTEATTNLLDGVRSQLEPEFKKDAEEKWKEQ